MLRNSMFQRVVTYLVLLTFGAGLAPVQTALASGSAPGNTLTLEPLQPTKPGRSPGNGAGTPLNPLGTVPGKGVGLGSSMPPGKAVGLQGSDYGQSLAQFEAGVAQAQQASPAQKAQALAALRAQAQAVAALEAQQLQAFTRIGEHVQRHQLPPEIVARHQAAVALHGERSARLKNLIAGLNGSGADAALQQLNTFTGQYRNHGVAHGRKPAQAPSRQAQRLTAAATAANGIEPPPQADDSAASPITPTDGPIKTLAASLGNNPVQIANWVHNNIRYTPGVGSIQGAAQTLISRQGNATDQASVLIALLRSSGIAARYVSGTVNMPVERAQAWLGVADVASLQTLLTQSGIANRLESAGGQAKSIQFEHVWVSAFVDYSPSRGAINKAAATWAPIDPSYKLWQSRAGLGLANAVNPNPGALYQAVQQSAACLADSGARLNPVPLQTALSDAQAAINQLAPADAAVAEVLGEQRITLQNHSILLGSLPYKIVQKNASAHLPATQVRQTRLRLYADSAAQAQGQPVIEVSARMQDWLGQRLTFSFAPATDADAAALASFMPKAHTDGSPVTAAEFPNELPAYLIHMKAQVRLAGEVIGEGGSFPLGTELILESAQSEPGSGAWQTTQSYPKSGEYHAFAWDAQGMSAAHTSALQTRLQTLIGQLNNRQAVERDALQGELLHQTISAYFTAVDAYTGLYDLSATNRTVRQPSYGRAWAEIKPTYALGIITKVSFPGVAVDIDVAQTAGSRAGAGNGTANSTHYWGLRSAQQVLDFIHAPTERPAQAVSALNLVGSAAAGTQTVFGIDSVNQASVLPQLTHSERSLDEIRNAVGNGARVFTPRQALSAANFNGTALLIDRAGGQAQSRLIGDTGSASAVIYPTQGMPWLALGPSELSGTIILANLVPAQQLTQQLASLQQSAGIRWQVFPARNDVAPELLQTRLAGAQSNSVCDALTRIVAASGKNSLDPQTPTPAAAPFFTSTPVTAAQAGVAYQYQAVAQDPANKALRYSLPQAPGGITVDARGLITWDRPLEGDFAITVRADNGQVYAEQRYLLSVGQAALPLDVALNVAPGIINQGETVTITVLPSGGSGTVRTALRVDGQIVAVDASGQAQVSGSSIGVHTIEASATDSQGTVKRSSLFSVRNPQDSTAPVAQITAPADDAEITAPVNIVGTANDDNLAYYQLLLRAGEANWQEIGRGTQSVNNGVLGKLDPTQLENGIYELALVVVDVNGQQSSAVITLDIYRDLKIGQFSLSFEDLNVEAAGVPIRVTRTYDTRKKAQNLDFGYGWSVDYQSVSLRKNIQIGLQWSVVARQLQLCLLPNGSHKVNISLPDGKVERFLAKNAQECAFAQIPPVDIQFSPLAGTTSRLEILNVPQLFARGGNLVDYDDVDNGGIWNPKQYKLTTEDKYQYYITEGIGITQIKDPTGNTLTYGRNGILHSNGQSVAFTRDAAGRITAITDPAGKTIRYQYDARGDLVGMTQRNGGQSRYQYNRSHGLTSYTDPNGNLAARYQYDEEGRLIAVYDAAGHVIETTHDTANNKEIVKDRRGNVTAYTYDSAGNISEKVDALGHKTTYSYDALGNETTITDPLGNVTQKRYHAQTSKTLSDADPLGNVTTYAYENDNVTLKNTQDARGNSTGYAELPNGGQSISEPLGRSSVVSVNSSGNISQMTLAGQSTTFEYDAKGNKTKETDASGNSTTYTYDANNREISRTVNQTINGVKQSLTTTRKLDSEGRVIEETDALGLTRKTEYNLGGQVTAEIDAQGRKTAYTYNSRGKLVKTTFPGGSFTSVDYDAENNKISETDQAGQVTRYEYDALNRLSKTTYPNGTTTQSSYDAAGRLVVAMDANGKRTENSYDSAGRLAAVKDANGNTTTYAYDANGNRTKLTTADNRVTQYEYDALNRLVKTTWPDNTVATVAWRVDGRKQSETDAKGNTTQYGYNALGQLNQVTQTVGGAQQVTQYGFDEQSNKVNQTDAEGRSTKWQFDANNRPTARTLPLGQTERFTYDAAGNLQSKQDFLQQQTRTSYNELNQAIQVVTPDGATIVNEYNPSGTIKSVTISGNATAGWQLGKTAYEYDAQNRLTKQTNPDGSFIAYGIDANGNIQSRSTGGTAQASTVTYQYDANNNLVQVQEGSNITRYTWDAQNRQQSRTTPNGIITTWQYDTNGRVMQIVHAKADNSIVTATQYTLDVNGQRVEMREYDAQSQLLNGQAQNPVRTSRYQYDDVNRLVQEKILDRSGAATRTTDYQYDKVGNRLQKTVATAAGNELTQYRYDSNDRLLQETLTPATGSQIQTDYTWDDNGNLKSKSVQGLLTQYVWNSDNRLIEVKQGPAGQAAQTIAKYRYDAKGHRVQKVEADKTLNYLTDDTFEYAQVLQETVIQGSQAETTHYTWGRELLQQTRGGQGVFYHRDGLGSTKALTDANGNLTDRYDYEAYGNVESRKGTTVNPYRYTGEYFDDSINLQYNRARFYDPQQGRFVSQDLFNGNVAQPVSLHKFLYANGNPVQMTDPSGYFSLGELNAGMSAIGQLSVRAATSFGQGAIRLGWRFASESGKLAEKWVERIVTQCLKPKKLDKHVLIDKKASKHQLDLIATLKNEVLNIEVKNKLPAIGSPALARLRDQLLAATKSGKDVVLVGGDKVSNYRLQEVIKYLQKSGVKTESVTFINGIVAFSVWLGEVYGEECLGL